MSTKQPRKYKTTKTEELSIKRVRVDPSEFVSLYVNDTHVQMTPSDFKLVLGVLSDLPTTNDRSLNKTIGEIRMSPIHIKRVVEVLQGQIKLYEATYGPIPSIKQGPKVPDIIE